MTRAHPLAIFILLAGVAPVCAQQLPRQRLLLDFGWKFHLGDDWGTGEAPINLGVSTGPAQQEFNDSAWATINLPHDWVVALPFDSTAPADHGYKPIGAHFAENSIGWYRRSFTLATEDSSKRIWVEFGGVFRNSLVYVNGVLVGRQPRGYSSFRYDVTDVVHYGGRNTVAVRVDASDFEGWFYEGAGIYRHVWLVKTAPVAIAPDGIFVYSRFANNVPRGPAQIHIESQLDNSLTTRAGVVVESRILDPAGKTVATTNGVATVSASSNVATHQQAVVAAPLLWSPEAPRLYTLITIVRSAGRTIDSVATVFGIRTLAFDANRGLLLNGRPYAVKGTADHQDHAGVGTALPDALQYFRIRTLKAMGSNALRTAHNEPTEELLEACDSLGMLVLDESRVFASDAQDLALLSNQVRRDRNHASVFLWSLGNEEPLQSTPTAARVARTMQRLVHQLDPSRDVTYAASVGNEFTGANSVTDVRGWNYHTGSVMEAYHAAHPRQPNIGTETASTITTRGIYTADPARGYRTAYDDSTNARPGVSTAERWWSYYATRPWLSGGFAWTGFDYRGENDWPDINANYGIIDIAGFPKDNYYYYKAWWGDTTVLHILPHWNWPGRAGEKIDVWCFGNLEEVELFLNGTSLGRKTMPRYSHVEWNVPYAPGTLVARGYRHGILAGVDSVETTGAPAAVTLTPDRATINPDGEDLSVVTVAVTDSHGRVVPVAQNLVHFDVGGPGKILGVGNGDPSSHEPDVYLNHTRDRVVALRGWRMHAVASDTAGPEVSENHADAGWQAVDVDGSTGSLPQHSSAVFRTRVSIAPEDLAAGSIVLRFGMIDDAGWVYVNGKLAGESHDWQASPGFDVGKLLHVGDNTIAVIVRNNDGPGGVNKGVSLDFPSRSVEAHWQRSVFNGLAQVIVQAGTAPGDIRLTARADGLASQTVVIRSRGRLPRPRAPH
ncbi:MAG: beta-galactosidase GalA [Gemmatimonadales bacterium]